LTPIVVAGGVMPHAHAHEIREIKRNTPDSGSHLWLAFARIKPGRAE